MEKRELGYDSPNKLKSLNETIKSNKSAAGARTDANNISDRLQTALDSMNTHTEINGAVAERATFTDPNIETNKAIAEHATFTDPNIDPNNKVYKDKELKIEEKDKIRVEKPKEEKKKYAGMKIDKKFIIRFDYNSNHLNNEAVRIMQKIIGIVKNHSKTRLIVKGHTDRAGNHESNIILSKQRADTVKNHLIEKGIELNRIETVSLAGSEPIASNDTMSGRRVNRRVEIEILNKG